MLERVQEKHDQAEEEKRIAEEKRNEKQKAADEKKKTEEENEKKKAEAEAKENEKAAELRPGFERELGESDAAKILKLSDMRLRLYIRFFFRVKVVNLAKVKGVELRDIVSPLLDTHYASSAAPGDKIG